MRLFVMSALAFLTVATVAGCGSSHQDSRDPGGHEGTRYEVIQMPDGFRNVAAVCDGSTGIYVTSRSLTSDLASGVAVYPNDPRCK